MILGTDGGLLQVWSTKSEQFISSMSLKKDTLSPINVLDIDIDQKYLVLLLLMIFNILYNKISMLDIMTILQDGILILKV